MTHPGNYYEQKRFWVVDKHGQPHSSSCFRSYAERRCKSMKQANPHMKFRVIDRGPEYWAAQKETAPEGADS